jgi:GT2 family glycosyltransferase/glycosyltransferase involved in cell wall biosynthesis
MIPIDDTLNRRLRASLRQSLSVAVRSVHLPSRKDLLPVVDAVSRGALVRAIRDMDRVWRCFPDDSVALAPIYGRLLALHSDDHYATLRLLQHALSHCPDADAAALMPLSYLRLDRFADAQLHLQKALADYCTSPASLLFSVAGTIVRHIHDALGWVGRGPRLELIGELSAAASSREVECRGGSRLSPVHIRVPLEGRRLFRYSLPDHKQSSIYEVVCGNVALLGSGASLPQAFDLDGRSGADERMVNGWARIGWHPQRPVRVIAEDVDGGRAEADVRRWPDVNGQWPFQLDLRSVLVRGDRFRILVQLPDSRWEPLADSPLLLEFAMRSPGPRPATLPSWGANESRQQPESITTLSHRITSVVIPVYRGREESLACIESVLSTINETIRVVVVDDATDEKQLASDLDALAARGHITLLRNPMNLGFVASVNRAAQHHPDDDLILLNSDTVVFGDGFRRLRAAAYSHGKVGTVTPLSNNGSIASYPKVAGAVIEPQDGAPLHALTSSMHSNRRFAIPVGVGFCLFIRRDCWQAIGQFDEAAFGKGYGEETDFCVRARLQGWSHCLAADVFVYHAGGSSFGSRRAALLDRSQRLMNLRYPGYDAFIASFQALDPLRGVRRGLDQERLARFEGEFVLLVTLALTGGVERFVAERCEALRARGLHPLLLRPTQPGESRRCELSTDAIAVPNLAYDMPGDLQVLAGLLQRLKIRAVEIQHFLDLDEGVIEMLRELDLPYEAYVHDYTWICPRVTLIDGSHKYCGEPAVEVCQRCVQENGSVLNYPKSVRDLRSRSARWLGSARRVIAPSSDTAGRLLRYFPESNVVVRPHTARIPSVPVRSRAPRASQRVAVIGAIGEHKGYDILLECARDAQSRRLPLEFVVIGHSQDDAPLLATGKVFITGRYSESEAQHLLAREQPDIAWFPSVWPETWCYALDYAIGARLPLAAFDMGAIAERIQVAGGGLLLPLDLPPGQINDRLLGGASNDHGFWPVPPTTINMQSERTERTEMIEKFNGETLQPAEDGLGASVQILPLPAGLYLFSVKAATPFRVTSAGYLTLPAVHVGLGPGARPDQVEFVAGPTTQGAWLFAVGDQLVARVQGSGVTLVLTSVRAPGGEVLSISVERLDSRASTSAGERTPEPLAAVSEQPAGAVEKRAAAEPAAIEGAAASLPLQVAVHVRTRGDLKFPGYPWAGRVAPGLWLESFSVLPLQRYGAADIEYKGLTGSGFETPWLSDDKPCGTKGMAVPLVGFAIRLKPNPAIAAEYDCEYSGYFQSGLTVGPLRNGAPCRSTVANDPLEGMQVRIVKRLTTPLPGTQARPSVEGEGEDSTPQSRATH